MKRLIFTALSIVILLTFYSCKDNPSSPNYFDNPDEISNFIINYKYHYTSARTLEFGYFTKNPYYKTYWIPLATGNITSDGKFTIKTAVPPDSILKGIKSVFNDPDLKTSNSSTKLKILDFCINDPNQPTYMVQLIKVQNYLNSDDTVKAATSVAWIYSDSDNDLTYITTNKNVHIKKGYNVINLIWPATSSDYPKLDTLIPSNSKWYLYFH